MNNSIRTVSASPTVDTNAYASGDLIGGKLTFADLAGKGQMLKIMTAVIVDQAKQTADLDLVLFRDNPGATTFTDQAALDVADADLGKVCGVIAFRSGQTFGFNDNGVMVQQNVGLCTQLVGTTLYGALVSRGTPTYAAATDVAVTLTAERPD